MHKQCAVRLWMVTALTNGNATILAKSVHMRDSQTTPRLHQIFSSTSRMRRAIRLSSPYGLPSHKSLRRFLPCLPVPSSALSLKENNNHCQARATLVRSMWTTEWPVKALTATSVRVEQLDQPGARSGRRGDARGDPLGDPLGDRRFSRLRLSM